jgi:hypothetical protein
LWGWLRKCPPRYRYLEFLLDKIDTMEKTAGGRGLGGEAGVPTSAYFTAEIEQRLECMESKQVRYTSSSLPVIGLNIPVDRAVNKPDVDAYQAKKRAKVEPVAGGAAESSSVAEETAAPVVPRVPFDACIEQVRAMRSAVLPFNFVVVGEPRCFRCSVRKRSRFVRGSAGIGGTAVTASTRGKAGHCTSTYAAAF